MPSSGSGCTPSPGGACRTLGSARNGAPRVTAVNLAENSPICTCWARRRIRLKAATSQNAVEPPLPSTTW